MDYWRNILRYGEFKLRNAKTSKCLKCDNLTIVEDAIKQAHSYLSNQIYKLNGTDTVTILYRRTDVCKDTLENGNKFRKYGEVKYTETARKSRKNPKIKSNYWVTLFNYSGSSYDKDRAFPIDEWGRCLFNYGEEVSHG